MAVEAHELQHMQELLEVGAHTGENGRPLGETIAQFLKTLPMDQIKEESQEDKASDRKVMELVAHAIDDDVIQALTAVKVFIDAMRLQAAREGVELSPRLIEYLNKASKNADRASSSARVLVNTLLDPDNSTIKVDSSRQELKGDGRVVPYEMLDTATLKKAS